MASSPPPAARSRRLPRPPCSGDTPRLRLVRHRKPLAGTPTSRRGTERMRCVPPRRKARCTTGRRPDCSASRSRTVRGAGRNAMASSMAAPVAWGAVQRMPAQSAMRVAMSLNASASSSFEHYCSASASSSSIASSSTRARESRPWRAAMKWLPISSEYIMRLRATASSGGRPSSRNSSLR